MPDRRPRKPWRVTLLTPGGPLTPQGHTSQKAAYVAVADARAQAARGETRAAAARVEQWESGRWALFERVAFDAAPAQNGGTR